MNKFKPKHYKFSLIFIACLAVGIFLYVQWVAINFNIRHAKAESKYLSDFTERALTRINANPDWFPKSGEVDGKNLGNHRLSLLQSYDALKNRFPDIPPLESMRHNKMFVFDLNLRGLLKVPNFVIIRPLFLPNGEKYFGYLQVDAEFNDEFLDETLFEEIQPVLYIALGSLVIMVIIQLRHINSINTTASAMAEWADTLNASSAVTPPPNFEVPRLNHIAFTINRSLSTLGQVLEKEQSFAKYTSHELRAPVAALSANIELLEMMMKDLSPKERQVLNRMEVAIADMKYQMEAMLWMSKEIEIDSEFKDCEIRELLTKSMEGNQYLLKGKPVETHTNEHNFVVNTHPILCQIVINNLVRNAYQNTFSGSVNIEASDREITITNKNSSEVIPSKRNESFGIGLVLVEKLIAKLNIHMNTIPLYNGRTVTLTFES